MQHPALFSTQSIITAILTQQLTMPARGHFRLLILSATVSGTRPFRDDLGLHKAYPAQYAYFIPLFYSYILSIKGPSSCGQSLESRI